VALTAGILEDMTKKAIVYAQSGGVTAVINASAVGVIRAAKQHNLGPVLAAQDGLTGLLNDQLIDTRQLDDSALSRLLQTPGGAFGSSRLKLPDPDEDDTPFAKLVAVLQAHNVGSLLYNGGNDSADTCLKIDRYARSRGFDLQCIAIPKTIDNDLEGTDTAPGFGSAAKYVAVSTLEASLDVASMAATSTKVFVLEVMGRHAGWLAAAAGLVQRDPGDPPHVILFPERPFVPEQFLAAVEAAVCRHGYCSVVVSEGIRDEAGCFLADGVSSDAFGHAQLGGVAPVVANLVQAQLGVKQHWAVSDYLQRAARHVASATDVAQALAVGSAAVDFVQQGLSGVMVGIQRDADEPYQWSTVAVPLSAVANREKKVPDHFITDNGFGITESCRRYLRPLIRGEAYPSFGADGLPEYLRHGRRGAI